MPLPFFLQPLLLVTYYQNRLLQLFGPLEQMVAAIVILGLAMQTPPPFWTAPPLPPILFNTTGIPQIPPPPAAPPIVAAPKSQTLPGPSTGNVILDKIYTRLPGWLQISPVNIALLLMCLNIGILMLGDDLKRRLKESWDIFWPPWQDRSKATTPTQSRSESSESPSGGAEKKTALEKSREAKTDATSGSKQSTASGQGDKPVSKDRSISTSDDGAKEKLSESEKARQVKDPSGTRPAPAESDVAKDKGKGRMEGERPGDAVIKPESTSDTPEDSTSSSKRASTSGAPASAGQSRSNAYTKDDKKPGEPSSDEAIDGSEHKPKSINNSDKNNKDTNNSDMGADTEDEDPLMSGDYRPLKSALKKSKKKPKQSKNIHHNFFMTMRGYMPSLIPFAHGFHPPPHEARNTLWWDNVPKNADHIMAAPGIAKEPESGDGDKDEKADRKKEKGGDDEKAKDDKKSDKEKEGVRTPEESKDRDKEKEKEKERAKAKAEAEAKARAQKEAEAKAARVKAESGSSSSSSSAPAISFDPQIQKAIYISQGLLCTLLYYMNPQIGFLLLAFFVWQYINTHNEVVLSLQAAKPPSSSSSSSPSSDKDRATHTSSSTRSRDSPPPPKTEKEPTNAERIEELDKMIKKLKSLPELTPEHNDKLQRAMMKRKQLMAESDPSTSTFASKDRSGEQRPDKAPVEPQADRQQQPSIEELEKKAKEMDEYVLRLRGVENLNDEQKARLVKAEERRKVLWKQVRSMKGNEPASFMPDQSSKSAKKQEELKGRIKELELYIIKYRKLENPTEEQKEKLSRAEMKRRALKKELLSLTENPDVGSSGLTVDEKESLVQQKE